MKAKLKDDNTNQLEQNCIIMQLSYFTELSDQELELLVGGCFGNGNGNGNRNGNVNGNGNRNGGDGF
ncbi:MAG: hypothetical protein ACFKPT_00040 [Gloeotrichia echinulata GP01]